MRFADRDIEAFWNAPATCHPRRVPPALRKALYRKLQMLDAAYAPSPIFAHRLETGWNNSRVTDWGSTAFG